MKCNFFITIFAPKGLSKISTHLDCCKLRLDDWKSGYNGKVILRCVQNDELDWNMDSSDNDYLVANGSIFGNVERAKLLLEDLEIAFIKAGYPYQIHLDDEVGNLKYKSSYHWVGHHDS